MGIEDCLMVSVKLSMIIIPPALNHELLSLGLPDRVLLIGGRKTQLIGLIFLKQIVLIFSF